jgi:small subunit ribosomal protein S16
LRRIGAKGRPFYRVVVAKSSAGRDGAFIENIGTYNPVVKPTQVSIDSDRALHWLMQGARPTETAAYLLNRIGVLEKYFESRPKARKDYGFLDKRTAATSVKSAVDSSAEPAPAPKPAAEVEAPEPAAAEPEAATTPEASAAQGEEQPPAVESSAQADQAAAEPPQEEPEAAAEAVATEQPSAQAESEQSDQEAKEQS